MPASKEDGDNDRGRLDSGDTLVGRRPRVQPHRLVAAVTTRPQSPEEEQRCVAAVRLFLTAITRGYIERRLNQEGSHERPQT